MGLAEALRLVSETSFVCSGAKCGRVLREDRGAPSGWIAVVPPERSWQDGSPQAKPRERCGGTRKHERNSCRRGGTIVPSSRRGPCCDRRRPGTSTGH